MFIGWRADPLERAPIIIAEGERGKEGRNKKEYVNKGNFNIYALIRPVRKS